MSLLKFLFVTICILWLIRLVARWWLPLLFQKMVSKAQQHTHQRYQKYNGRPEGSIQVDYIPPRNKNNREDKAGEFIDYEEINP